ncbi:hypothetical protein [Sanguibacter antarcticus]|uniref:Uncharacterized protein n=1 Tax=Sanguibacter antarcticus TaxID=372484 RepID=A0A2A9E3R6_9MICO|nr:hypothetical protein [Sanguibacter antarcticus]PFG33211.1 hypothetical protein ATL42_1071 [Sanguibacter antarcticus]
MTRSDSTAPLDRRRTSRRRSNRIVAAASAVVAVAGAMTFVPSFGDLGPAAGIWGAVVMAAAMVVVAVFTARSVLAPSAGTGARGGS